MTDFTRFLTVKQIAQQNPAFSESGLRWLIFNAESNGLDAALVRLGRRVLIDQDAFQHWIEAHREKTTMPQQRQAADEITAPFA